LNKLAKVLFGSRDPAKQYFHEAPYRFRKVNDRYEIRLRLPFVSSRDVDLYKKDEDLIVRLGSFKRHISLPQRMMRCEPLGARVKNGELIIELGGGAYAQAQKGREAPEPTEK